MLALRHLCGIVLCLIFISGNIVDVVDCRFSSKSTDSYNFDRKRSDGKCADAERCCIGRDSSCSVHGKETSVQCYCDEGCLETGDCCSDYQEICNVQGKPQK